MKIFVLTHSFPRYKGDYAGIFVEELCNAYSKNKHQVIVLLPYTYDFNRNFSKIPYKIYFFKYIFLKKWHKLGYTRVMEKDLQLKFYNYILLPFFVFFALINAIRIVLVEKPDIIHCQWAIPMGIIAYFINKIFKIHYIVSCLGSDIQVLFKNFIFKMVGKLIFNNAKKITTNSEELKEAIENIQEKKNNIDLIIYGADKKKFYPIEKNKLNFLYKKLGIDENKVILFTLGRFVPKKGFEYAIKACSIIKKYNKNFVFLIGGEGDLIYDYKKLIKNYDLRNYVKLCGRIDATELIYYYNLCDIFIMPSVRKPIDGLNVCLVEAMACGKAIIATNVCGNPLVVKHNYNGFLVPEKQEKELAKLILKLLNDDNLRNLFAQSSRKLFLQKFNWESISKEILK